MRRRACLVLGLAVAAALPAPASAAVTMTDFKVEPASKQGGGHPNVTITQTFDYSSGSDSVKDAFVRLQPGLLVPYDDESFDLVFCVTLMHHNPTPAKKTLLSEMWRVARPGGRLLFLEDFVFGKRSENSTVYPMSVIEFVGLLLEATNGQVSLEHVESLRYPHDDVTRGGIIAVSKLGVPQRW